MVTKMKHLFTITLLTILVICCHRDAVAQQQNVDFRDASLAAEVRTAIVGLDPGDPIPLASLQALTTLNANSPSVAITDLTGLEEATSLTQLFLEDNQVSTLSPISGLTALTNLNLRANEIRDISDLSGLTALTRLDLGANEISDISALSGLTALMRLIADQNMITTITALSGLTALETLDMDNNRISSISALSGLTALETLDMGYNRISSISALSGLTALTILDIQENQISDISALSGLTALETLRLDANEISDISALSGLTALETLTFGYNRISDISALSGKTALASLYVSYNRISDISVLSGLTALTILDISANQISDLSPLSGLTGLLVLSICWNPYTDISPLEGLTNLFFLYIDRVFLEANSDLLTTNSALVRLQNSGSADALTLCEPLPEPPPEAASASVNLMNEPEPEVERRRHIMRCGLGCSPHSQYQHGELPKVMIYALEFEYDPAVNGGYRCKAIEIRTGEDSIETLDGWKLYFGTRYNPSYTPIALTQENSQITNNVLRLTPEMMGVETFACSTLYLSGQPLPSVHYVLRTDENVLVDTAYSCYLWGQIATTQKNGIWTKSARRILSAALREMETPRLERYISSISDDNLTYMDIEAFGWDRAVLSDWLLPESEASAPAAPSAIQRELTTTWGSLKKRE